MLTYARLSEILKSYERENSQVSFPVKILHALTTSHPLRKKTLIKSIRDFFSNLATSSSGGELSPADLESLLSILVESKIDLFKLIHLGMVDWHYHLFLEDKAIYWILDELDWVNRLLPQLLEQANLRTDKNMSKVDTHSNKTEIVKILIALRQDGMLTQAYFDEVIRYPNSEKLLKGCLSLYKIRTDGVIRDWPYVREAMSFVGSFVVALVGFTVAMATGLIGWVAAVGVWPWWPPQCWQQI